MYLAFFLFLPIFKLPEKKRDRERERITREDKMISSSRLLGFYGIDVLRNKKKKFNSREILFPSFLHLSQKDERPLFLYTLTPTYTHNFIFDFDVKEVPTFLSPIQGCGK